MRRWLAIIGAFTVVAVIVIAVAWSRRGNYRDRFERIPIGAHQREVLRLLGPPGHSRKAAQGYNEYDEMTWRLRDGDDTVMIGVDFEESRVVAKYISPRK